MIHHVLALLLLCTALLAQAPVLIQNTCGGTQTDYVFVGMPTSDLPEAESGLLVGGGHEWRWQKEQHGVRVQVVGLQPNTLVRCEWKKADLEPFKFELYPHLATYWSIFVPQFDLGGQPGVFSQIEESWPSDFCRWWHMRWHWAAERVTVDLWLTAHHGYQTLEWTAHATYGTVTNDGQPQSRMLPALTMRSAGPIQADFYTRLGIPQHSEWNAEQLRFVRTYKPAGEWHRARRYPLSGAILASGDPGIRHAGVKVTGLYTGWSGKWMALGVVPARGQDFASILQQRRSRYQTQVLNQPRDRAQPESSGTTGEQVDFGAANDLAVTSQEPWEIHDAVYHVQSFALRPTANKEPGGRPMQASLHPLAQTYNQRPDLEWGLGDRLGWPGKNQISWITGYTTSDDEHRADNLLHAYYALTRAPDVAAIIRDHIELDGTDVYRQLTGAMGAPRAVGRLLTATSNQLWLGFEGARPWLVERFERALRVGGWVEHSGPVRTFGSKWAEAKYGWRCDVDASGKPLLVNGRPVLAAWNDPTSLPINGWQPWQEAICARGMLCYSAVTGDQRGTDLALALSRVVCDAGFYEFGNKVLYAYAVRFNQGQWFPPSSYDGGITVDAYTDGATSYWAVPCAILLASRGDLRAQKIVNAWLPIKSMAQARWWALR